MMAKRSRRFGYSRLHLESLEQRRLLAADLEPMGNGRFIQTIDWNGREAEVEAGSWIVGVARLEGTRAQAQSQANDLILSSLTPNTSIQVDRMLLSQQAILIRTPYGMTYDAVREELGDVPGLRYIEPNFVVRVAAIPNDSQFGQLWGMNNTGQSGGVVDADIDATNAWDITTGSASQAVAVIDTGVNYNHPDLIGNMWSNPGEVAGDNIDNDNNGFVDDVHGWDFFNDDNNPMDDHGHGTHCAGTIGAVGNNGIGVAGVNWDVSLVALKFLGANGSGTEADAADAIHYATLLKRSGIQINVTSNSWGGGDYSQTLFDAITVNGKEDMLFIAAAGNSNSNNEVANFYPSNYPHEKLISVAATDRFDNKSSFSSYGATRVDLGAPGSSILSSVLGGGYGNASGTSMATPHVAGAAVLAWSLKPDATANEIRQALFGGVDPKPALNGITVTGGRLNVHNTLNLLIPTGPKVIAQTPVGGVTTSVNEAVVTFRDAMDTTSFSLADIVAFTGPGSVDLSSSITGFTWVDATNLKIEFAAQTARGLYTLTLAPSILDSQGRPLDQDGDRSNGESSDDRYQLTFAIEAPITYVADSVDASVLNLSAGDAGVLTLLDHGDDHSMLLDLGEHSFTFYGKTYDQIVVSSNGLISLGGEAGTFLNEDLSERSEAGIIAALWDDWQTDFTTQDAVLAKFDGSRLIIEWSDVTRFLNAPSSVSFQLELQLNTGSVPGKIQFHYLDVDTGNAFAGGSSGTVGIRPPRLDPSQPLLASFNATQPWLAAGESLLIEAPTDVRLTSVSSLSSHQWTVTYEVHNVAAAPFSLSALWSNDGVADGTDTWLSEYAISQSSELSVGVHTVVLDLGSELSLPGAGLPLLPQEGSLLLMADFGNALRELDSDPFQEDNALAYSGVYHLPNQPLVVFGSSQADSSVVNAVGSNLRLVLNSVTTLYPAAQVPQIAMYGLGGNDTLSVNNLSKEARLFGGPGNDTLTGGRLNDVLHGGAGDDDMVGGTGNDLYLFVAGNAGSDWLSDASGIETLDFSGETTGVTISLGLLGIQNVHGSLQVELASNIAFENVIGGSGDDSLTGNGRANLLEGKGGNDTLQGDLGNDVYLFQVDAPLGNDTLSDTGGIDTLDFSSSTTDFQVDLGSSLLQSVNANLGLQLTSNASFENVNGGAGNDILIGNTLSNILNGGAGSDVLRGGKGNDTYRFGVAVLASEVDTIEELAAGGTDLLDFSELPSSRPVSIDLGQTLLGNDGTRTIQVAAAGQNLQLENLTGGAGDDLLVGNSLPNSLRGGAGSDTLRGAAGNDTYMFTLAVGSEQDTIDEAANGGIDTLNFAALPATVGVSIDLSSSTTAMGSHVGRTLSVLTAGTADHIENLLGGSGPDVLQGGNAANSLTGNAGNDLLIGGGGDDVYLFARVPGAAEVDTVSELAGGGMDTLSFATMIASQSVTVDLSQDMGLASHAGRTINTASGGEALHFENVIGGLGNDLLYGNAANNSLVGGAGNDSLDGREGDDILEGGAGNDQMAGGDGGDTYRFKAASGIEVDVVMEGLGPGGDWLDFGSLSSSTPVKVYLNAVDQVLATHNGRTVQTSNAGEAQYFENVLGGAGNDEIHGNDADNVLLGMRGNDWLDGNAGFDTLDGGLGNDVGLDGEVLLNFP